MAQNTNTSQTLFPEIGKVVDETTKKPEVVEHEVVDDDERPVQEIESLCMKCYQQVCRLYIP